MTHRPGKLWLVATPIGNKGDWPPRAIETLGACDVIAAEDTRYSGRLLASFGIKKPLISYFEGNERERSDALVARCVVGETVGLITSAGHPAISDPGYRIVAAAQRAGVEVSVIPGACAAVSALAVSGLPSDEFTFLGFVPRDGRDRETVWARMRSGGTFILYESAKRLARTLGDLHEHLQDPETCVVRELTKLHEEIRWGRASVLQTKFSEKTILGEITIVARIEHKPVAQLEDGEMMERIRRLRERSSLSDRDLADAMTILCDRPKKDAYRLVLESRENDGE